MAAFGRPSRLLAMVAGVMLAAALAGAAQAETVTVSVDEARIMQLPDNVATIVIGNPLIADATLQSGGVLVLTGKGFGSTNMLALNRSGKIMCARMRKASDARRLDDLFRQHHGAVRRADRRRRLGWRRRSAGGALVEIPSAAALRPRHG